MTKAQIVKWSRKKAGVVLHIKLIGDRGRSQIVGDRRISCRFFFSSSISTRFLYGSYACGLLSILNHQLGGQGGEGESGTYPSVLSSCICGIWGSVNARSLTHASREAVSKNQTRAKKR